MEKLLENIAVFQIATELFKVTLGAGLCFGALKWRRGLLTTTAIGWGAVLGIIFWYLFSSEDSPEILVISVAIGAILFPILTYTIPGINRFVLGFLVGMKLFTMVATVLLKQGSIDIELAFVMPLIAGALIGLLLMAWTQMRVSAVVIGCSFIGASEIAPVISEWWNRAGYALTGDISYLFDPMDLLFALFKIELTDKVTLISLLVMLVFGCCYQLKRLSDRGIPYSTPVIGFEIDREDDGEIEEDW